MLENELTKRLKINYPIIQAPMAGGATTSKLVAAVSNSGGLGFIGAGYLTPSQLREQIREIKTMTSNCFGVNLFVPQSFHASEDEVAAAMQVLEPIHQKLKISQSKQVDFPSLDKQLDTFKQQIKVIIEEKVPICSFTFGIPSKEVVTELKQHHIFLIGTATTVSEAKEVEHSGMDAVVLQGSEAGGHRGNFSEEALEKSMVGLMSLIPQAADHVTIPVIAAGGIMDGRGLIASIFLGAKAVQMGTAFLTCVESGAHPIHKEKILHSKENEIVITRSFSGKCARGIENQFIKEMRGYEELLPCFPIQNTLTQAIRNAAGQQNQHDYMSLWSGQSPRLAKNQTVENLINSIICQAEKLKNC